MNQTNGILGPTSMIQPSVGQKPAGRRGTSETCFRSCSASTTFQLLLCLDQQFVDLGGQNGEVGLSRMRQRPDDDQVAGSQFTETRTHDLAQAALGSVAHYSVADGLGYDETHARSVGIIGVSQAVRHEMLCAHPDPGSEDSSEVFAAADPMCRVKHAQAEMSERPLRRRAARIERPARVRIRRRKPCFLARLRLLGWNVRLLTSVSDF